MPTTLLLAAFLLAHGAIHLSFLRLVRLPPPVGRRGRSRSPVRGCSEQ